MDFYAIEGAAIEDDALDNKVLERVLREHEEGKRLYADARKEIEALNAEVERLKTAVKECEESNRRLQAELRTRSQLQGKE